MLGGPEILRKMFRTRRFIDCYWLCVCHQPVTKHTLHSLLSEVMDQSPAPPGSGPELVANKYYGSLISFSQDPGLLFCPNPHPCLSYIVDIKRTFIVHVCVCVCVAQMCSPVHRTDVDVRITYSIFSP